MFLSYSGLTDKGLVRTDNQDSIYLPRDGKSLPAYFLVADGMGGANGGKTASEMAINHISTVFSANRQQKGPEKALRQAIETANKHIFDRAQTDPQLHGMGTTLVGLFILEDDGALIVNVGDSRCYLLREGELHQISEDHSVIQEMVRNGKMTEDQAKEHGMRNMLSKAVGTSFEVTADIFAIKPLEINDLFLLCSDGLHGVVPNAHIQSVLTRPLDLTSKVRQLVEMAKDNGGPDNISVVLVRINQGEYSPDPDEITLGNSGTTQVLAPKNGPQDGPQDGPRSRFGFFKRLLGK